MTGAGNFCDVAAPIYVDDADYLTPETARQILKNNETGRQLCGW